MQIIRITSEALQATVRRLLPSQQGFGEDLEASNVIVPVIDLTPSAEGSELPVDLSRAAAFGSNTTFGISNNTSTIIDTTGFYRVFGVSSIRPSQSEVPANSIQLSDGLASKIIWRHTASSVADGVTQSISFDLVVFLRAGDSCSIVVNSSTGQMWGSNRQIADINGNIVNPNGFTSE